MIEGALLTETLGAAILLVGGAIVGFAGLGLIRLSDPFMRMHAATKAGVVGAGLVMLGVGVASGTTLGVFTGVAGLLFLCATAPIAATGWSSKIGRQVAPPSSDRHTPPVAAPT